jgi:hypothetical protein
MRTLRLSGRALSRLTVEALPSVAAGLYVWATLAPVSLAVHDEYGWRGSVGWLAFCWHVGTMI